MKEENIITKINSHLRYGFTRVHKDIMWAQVTRLVLLFGYCHTNRSIAGVNITPYEAHKYLIENLEDPQRYDFSKSDWLSIRKELSKLIKDNKSDKNFLDNQIYELIMRSQRLHAISFHQQK